jgi:hypothetical protein
MLWFFLNIQAFTGSTFCFHISDAAADGQSRGLQVIDCLSPVSLLLLFLVACSLIISGHAPRVKNIVMNSRVNCHPAILYRMSKKYSSTVIDKRLPTPKRFELLLPKEIDF